MSQHHKDEQDFLYKHVQEDKSPQRSMKHHFPAEIRVTSDKDSCKVLFVSLLKAVSSLQWLPNASKPLQAFDGRWPWCLCPLESCHFLPTLTRANSKLWAVPARF